eukprot:COSAG06_NODE_42795_length_378_cov_1.032258_1_plen_29_part_01
MLVRCKLRLPAVEKKEKKEKKKEKEKNEE